MKSIEVVAAVIRRGDRIFATQRGYGDFKDWWEFPGGKMEPGEKPEDALKREIREELDAEIYIPKFLQTVEWDYPKFHLTMHCYMCSLVHDALHLNEHESACWLDVKNLHAVQWLPADEILLPLIKSELEEFNGILNPPNYKIGDTIYWVCDDDQRVHHAKVLMVNYALLGDHICDINYEVFDECGDTPSICFIDEFDASDRDYTKC